MEVLMTTLETLLNDPDTAGVWNLVPERSTVAFTIKKFWGLTTVKGRFLSVNGDGQITGKGAVFGRLSIQAASLRTGIHKRDEHLQSADFFDIKRFPEISVEVTAMQPATGNAADLQASFSIKEVTAPLPLPIRITVLDDGSVRISAITKVNLGQFGLDWNRFNVIGRTAVVTADTTFVRAPL
jgi:polyisoprenoid-binding protein YceI